MYNKLLYLEVETKTGILSHIYFIKIAGMCCHMMDINTLRGIEPRHAIPVLVMINSCTQILLGQKPVPILSDLLF